jgi:DNA-binding beta-propeller fold protein YncE
MFLLAAGGALALGTGALTQPAGTAGCISEDGSGPCRDGRALDYPHAVVVSPDGKSVYVASHGIARFDRNTTTGAVTQPSGAGGCISENGAEPCRDGHGMIAGVGHLAVSPDGKSVYATAGASPNFHDPIGSVVRLKRNTSTGAITQLAGTAGCISEDGSGSCADGHGINGGSVAVSPDGRSVYLAGGTTLQNGSVVSLERNTSTGAITEPAGTAGCISEDGSGPCADGHGMLRSPDGVAVSADGKSVYLAVASANALVRIRRNATFGSISQPAGSAGCISEDGSGPCSDGRGLSFPTDVAVSPEGNSVYAASGGSKAVARFNRAP